MEAPEAASKFCTDSATSKQQLDLEQILQRDWSLDSGGAPHMVRDYGITSYSLGTNLVYRKDKFPNGGPQSWTDFWDVKKFPGSRCFYDRSFSCLAFALLA